MNKKIILAALTLLISMMGYSEVSYAKEPKNLDGIKQSLIKYYDSGEYSKDQMKVVDHAMLYLKTRLESEKKSPQQKKLAVVLDIDETALSNYPDMKNMDFGGSLQDIIKAEGKGTDPVIQPTLELYRYAEENHVAIFFVTGRTENYRAATARNLKQAGYNHWVELILKPENYNEKSAAPYKMAARDNIEKQGYDIILNMGDQQSDLTGGHADKTFKLPNPYYFIP